MSDTSRARAAQTAVDERHLVCVDEVIDALREASNGSSERSSTSVVDSALRTLGFDSAQIETVPLLGLPRLYNQRMLPVRLSLGAAAAIHIAQRGERMGLPDAEIVINAERVLPHSRHHSAPYQLHTSRVALSTISCI